MNKLYSAILELENPDQVEGLSRFFKTGKGQYGEGDKFLGIKVPHTREVVKQLWKECDINDVEECLKSEYHEVRLAALLTLVQLYKHAKKSAELQEKYVNFYLAHTDYINNWDLVDLSCYEILGDWVLKRDKQILYDLAQNGKTIWERRIGIVSTMALARNENIDDIFNIAEIFLKDGRNLHDLLQKAVGWLLREAGKRNENRLKEWLETNYKIMPRTMLRYAIEKLPEADRTHFIS